MKITQLKTLIHTYENNTRNNETITNLQTKNKQLHHKIDKLQKQNNMKPKPYIEDKPTTKHKRHMSNHFKTNNNSTNSTNIHTLTDDNKRKCHDKQNHTNS